MSGNRLRWGAIAWVLTLQFFVVETIAQLRYPLPYSRADDVISDLGAGHSAAAPIMNASLVVQGALIAGGLVLLAPQLRRLSGRVALGAGILAAFGAVLAGVFPVDRSTALHDTGALLYLFAGAITLLSLAYTVRRRSEPAGMVLAVLGLAGAAAAIFFVDGITEYLGRGGTERVAAYVVPVGLVIAGLALWRLAGRPEAGAGRPSRRQLREQARAERAERARERDAALEAAVGHRPDAAPQQAAVLTGDDAVVRSGPDDGFDPDDPWATPRER